MRARYLIVKLAALGDVAMASTLVGAIRARDADAHITWVCGMRVAPLVRCFAGVDEVIETDEAALLRGGPAARLAALARLWRSLVPRRFDHTVLGHADGRYRALLAPVRTGTLRALDHVPSPDMLPVPGRYYGDEYARLLDPGPSRGPIAGHASLADVHAALGAERAAEPPGVVLVPGGTRNVLRESALRRWPVERYAAVAGRLRAAGLRVTLVGDAGDAWVRPHFAAIDVRDALGVHDLPGTLRVLRDASLVISHDTGPLHLARLAGAPVLALFGPTNPAQFVVEDARTAVLWGGAALACRPCYDGREFARCASNACMQDISTETVVERALSMLGRPRG